MLEILNKQFLAHFMTINKQNYFIEHLYHQQKLYCWCYKCSIKIYCCAKILIILLFMLKFLLNDKCFDKMLVKGKGFPYPNSQKGSEGLEFHYVLGTADGRRCPFFSFHCLTLPYFEKGTNLQLGGQREFTRHRMVKPSLKLTIFWQFSAP